MSKHEFDKIIDEAIGVLQGLKRSDVDVLKLESEQKDAEIDMLNSQVLCLESEIRSLKMVHNMETISRRIRGL